MSDLPIMDEALAMYQKGMTTGVNAFNQNLVAAHIRFETPFPDWQEQILYDPQTSGGLLVALPARQAQDLVAALRQSDVPAAVTVGDVHRLDGKKHLIFE
jgi:selenide,water dikinase